MAEDKKPRQNPTQKRAGTIKRPDRATGARKYLAVQLDSDLVEWFRAGCKAQGKTQSDAVEEAIRTWLEEKKILKPFTKAHKGRLWRWLKENAVGDLCCSPPRFRLERWGIVQHTGQPGEAVVECTSCGGRWAVSWFALDREGLPFHGQFEIHMRAGRREKV